MVRTIPLTRGFVALVDDEDYEWLSQWKWYADVTPRVVYAARRQRNVERKPGEKRRLLRMHREILGLGGGASGDVDHIDHDGLNNTRANLRVCSRSENCGNQRKRPGGNRYKGVYWHKPMQKWTAQISVGGRRKYLGLFATELEAAAAYDRAAVERWGQFAHLNLPLS